MLIYEKKKSITNIDDFVIKKLHFIILQFKFSRSDKNGILNIVDRLKKNSKNKLRRHLLVVFWFDDVFYNINTILYNYLNQIHFIHIQN